MFFFPAWKPFGGYQVVSTLDCKGPLGGHHVVSILDYQGPFDGPP